MAQLKTADQMLRYCKEHDMDGGARWNRNRSHFQVIADDLKPGEYALIAFTGLMGGFNWGFAVTKERIIIGQERMLSHFVKSVYLDKLNDITMRVGPIHGFLEIDTIKEKFEICVKPETAGNIRDFLQAAIENCRGSKQQIEKSNASSIEEEVLAMKRLLDMGAITQEEYDAKKKQLLGL